MKWLRQLLRASQSQPLRPAPVAVLAQALEPRMMFDGAALATAAEVLGATEPAPQGETEAAAAAASQVVFIDATLASNQQLLGSLPAGAEVVQLQGGDGLQQIADYLADRQDLAAIHLLSHGEAGAFRAGTDWIDAENLSEHADALARIGAALSEDGDILLYGCQTGSGEAGSALLAGLASLTRADVAASSDNTGAAALGGDWALEQATGEIEAAALSLDGYDALLAAPTTLDFDRFALSQGGSPRVFDGWTVTLNKADGSTALETAGNFLDVVNTGLLGYGTDRALDVSGFFGDAASARFVSTSGDEFSLQSFAFENRLGAALQVQGFRDGGQVVSLNFSSPSGVITLVTLTGTAWQSIDEFRIVQQDGSADILFSIDDITLAAAAAPNVAPVIANLNGDSVTFTEGGSAVLLDAGSNATLTDSNSANFNGGNVTVSITGNRVTTEDLLGIQNAGLLTTSGSNVLYSGTTIGTFTGGSGSNDLVITLNANATPANVQALLRSLSYRNSNTADPSTAARTVSITVNDGDGGTSAASSVSVGVIGVNDAPTLSASALSPTYTENGSAVELFSGVAISSVESGQTITALSLTVSGLSDGASEILRIDGSDVALTHGNSVTSASNGMTVYVSLSGGIASVSISKSGGISAATAQTLVDGLSYRNASEAPGTASRTVTLTGIQDSGGTANGGIDSTVLSIQAMVAVAAVNDAPVAVADSFTVAEDSGATVLDVLANDSIAPDAGETLTVIAVTQPAVGGTVSLVGGVVSFTPAVNWFGTTSFTYTVSDGNGGTATATATISVTPVNDAPLAVADSFTVAEDSGATVLDVLANDSIAPDAGETLIVSAVTQPAVGGTVSLVGGVVSFTPAANWFGTTTFTYTVSDGNGGTTTATATVTVTPVNDAPTLSTSAGTTVFTEANGGSSTPVAIDPGLSLNDVDSATLASATVSITGNFQSGQDTLVYVNDGSAMGNIVASYNAATGVLGLSSSGATATLAQWQAALRAVIYTNSSETPNTATRTIAFVASDGGLSSVVASKALSVVSTNDTPTIHLPASIGVTEDVASALTGISFADVDAGSGSMAATLSVVSGSLAAMSGSGVTVAGSGTDVLTLTGSLASLNAFIAAAQVTFTTAANATGDVTLTVSIDDGGNSGSDPGSSGTASSEAASSTLTLSVAAINDAPVNSLPAAASVDQDVGLVFSSANGNAIVIGDVDAGSGSLRVTLTASNGLLSLPGTSGLSFLVGSGAGDARMTFEGSLADINLALNGLMFTPTPGYYGAASLQVVSNDLGLSGSGGGLSDSDSVAITVERMSPLVTALGSSSPDGAYKVGDTLLLTVSFDRLVTVDSRGGTPTLQLETGSIDRSASYLSGSGSSTLTFAYTVQEGDVSGDLDYTSVGALALNGASILSGAGYAAILALPAMGGSESIAGQHAIGIDGILPQVVSVGVPADGTYVAGDNLDFTVNLSEAVSVDTSGGTPRLAVTLAGGPVYAEYLSGSGTASLVFRLTVASGQLDQDGIALAGSLDLNGGTLRDAVGNPAQTALNGVAATLGVRVDAVVPTVVGVAVPADGDYNAGSVLTFTVQTSETVVVDTSGGTPRLALDIDGTTRYASYVSGSGSGSLVFQYSVQTGDNDADGIAVGGLDLNGGSVRDAAGNALSATLNSVASLAGVRVDTTEPTVSTITPLDTSPTIAGSVRYQVSFTEAVSGVDASDFVVTTTGTASAVVSSVTQLDAQTYLVSLDGLRGEGMLGLELVAAGSGIFDPAGNPLSLGASGASYELRNVVGGPELRSNPPSIAISADTSLFRPLVPVEPPTPMASPLLPPALFASTGPGSGIPALGELFRSGGGQLSSVIAQVFSSAAGVDGAGRLNAAVFGTSTLAGIFAGHGTGPVVLPAETGSEPDCLAPYCRLMGAPTLGQQLETMHESALLEQRELARALGQVGRVEPQA